MSLISVQNLTFTHEGSYTPVFENVSFQIDTDWKLGFVGRNGRGKTTFLNILSGKYEYSGKITSNLKCTYFPFDVNSKDRPAYDVITQLCPQTEDWLIFRELSYLNVDAEILYRTFSTLSNGEQTKLLLAALFLIENNYLLIDEPTNHLDASARATVSEYLKRKKGYILVSHDRAFLDGCVDHILAINKTDIEVQSGNFSCWFENFERRQAFETACNEKLKKDIARLKDAAERSSAWAEKTEASKYGKADSGLKKDRGYVGHKSAKLMKRAKSAEARQIKAAENSSKLLKNVETSERLKIYPLEYRSERLASFNCVEIFYGGRSVCGPLSFEILRGERVALNGKNGCGKSSLLKMISGEKLNYNGGLFIGSGLIVSYVPQTADGISGNLSRYAAENGLDENLFKAILSKMDFTAKNFDCGIQSLSEGQKKKILLAHSLSMKANLYVWDEPLNYIDIYSRMQIEALITEFKPTMVFVEHDVAFRENVATKVIEI